MATLIKEGDKQMAIAVPTQAIDTLERQLATLAYRWRSIPDALNAPEAQPVVLEYHAVMDQLWQQGWTGRGLLPDAELPDELMPQYFQDYWHLA